jgi:tetratricopeptide (TPR) repeat protein
VKQKLEWFTNVVGESFCRRPKLFVFFLLTLLSFIAYANSLPNSFHFDDIHGIVTNPTVHNLKKYLPAYFTDPTSFTVAMRQDWRPIVQITYALNYLIGGLDPVLFRLFDLVLHIGAAFLIYVIVAEIAKGFPPNFPADAASSRTLSATFAALLFAVHTVNTEAVNYIWARSSLLVAFFYLLAFYCFLRGPLSWRKERNIFWHLSGVAAYAAGLATKATAITLPAILFLYELLFLNPAQQNPLRLFRAEPRRLIKYLPLAALSVAYVVLRLILLPSTLTRIIDSGHDPNYQPPGTYLLTQFRIWVYYLKLFLFPYPLILDFHGFGWSHSLWDIRVWAALAIILTVLSLAWRLRKSQPLVSFFIVWFFVALLPEGSFIPLTEPIYVYRAYLAYVGLAVVSSVLILNGFVWVWGRFKGESEANSRRFWISYSAVFGIILIVLTAATIKRNQDWRNEMTLWSDVLRKDPTNPRAHMFLGLEYLEREDYKEAERMFEKAVQLNPKDYYGYVLRGYFNSLVDRDERALSDYNLAIKLDPRAPYSYFNRGELYSKRGQYDKALNDYEAALRLKPFYTDAHAGIARVYWLTGEFKKLAEACRKIIEIDVSDPRGHRCLQVLETQPKAQ